MSVKLSITDVCKLTALTSLEVITLRQEGILSARTDDNGVIYYTLDDVDEVVAKFDKILVSREGLSSLCDSLYPGENKLKPIGYEWVEGTPLWRLSDILKWRKEYYRK